MSKSLEIYRREASKGSILTKSQECELAELIKMGDKHARDLFVLSNIKFVQFIAKKYIGCGLPLEDIIQEGNIGMIYAVDTFDHTRGFKFVTYAVKCIRGFISNAIADHGNTVRNPQHVSKPYYKIQQVEHKLTGDLGYRPTIEQLAKEMDLTQDDIENYILSYTKACVLNETLPISSDQDISEFYSDEDAYILTEKLEKAVQLLADVHSEVLTYKLGLFGREKMNPYNIAKRMGIYEPHVYVLVNEALECLEELL